MVRPLGGVAWTSCRTPATAERAAAEARARGLRQVVVVDGEAGEIVPPPEEE